MITPKGMVPYPIPKPTDDYLDALATGRCCIYCLDLEHSIISARVLHSIGFTCTMRKGLCVSSCVLLRTNHDTDDPLLLTFFCSGMMMREIPVKKSTPHDTRT